MTSKHWGWGIVVLWIVVASSTLTWSLLDCRPPAWDQSGHLMSSVRYARALATGPRALARGLADDAYSWAPLYHLLVALVFVTFGVVSWAPAAVNAAFAGMLIYATWEIGKLTYPEEPAVAFTATVLTATSPFLAYVSHEALLDYASVALVSLAAMVVIRTEVVGNTKAAALAGAVVAAALLVKPTAAIFLAGPLLIALAPAAVGRDAERRRRLLVLVTCAGVPALAWYVPHWRDTVSLLGRNLADAAREGDPSPMTLESVAFYLHGFYRLDFAPVLALTLLAGVLRALSRWRETRYLWTWVLPAWLVLTFLMPNKDFRYSLPLIPGLAVLGTGGLLWISLRGVRLVVSALVVSLAATYYFASLFGPSGPTSWLPGTLGRSVFQLHVPAEARPLCEDWKHDEIVDALAAAMRKRPSDWFWIGVIPSSRNLNPPAIHYRLVLGRLPADVLDFGGGEDWHDAVDRADFLITKTGDQGLEHVTRFNLSVEAYVASRPDLFEIILTVPLPDGSIARVYERVRPGWRGR